MKILIMAGPMYPQIGNNAELMGKLIPFFQHAGHEVQLLADAFGASQDALPKQVFGVPVHWVTGSKTQSRRLYHSAVSRIKHDRGFTGEIGAGILADAASALRKQYAYEWVLATMQPYHMALAASRLRKVRRAVYLMDPPDAVFEQLPWGIGQKQLMPALQHMDSIFTTPFIREAIEANDEYHLADKLVSVGFPHIGENKTQDGEIDLEFRPENINLLFCGALFADVRSPDCFLEVVKRLDERFTVTFMGRNCPEFWENYAVETKASVRVLPAQPYAAALNAMHHADILVNIGNNMLVHMPSKTLDYINTGKPIVNFHKFKNCPTLHYMHRYPLCLNMYEPEMTGAEAAERFVRFCEQQKGNSVPREEIDRLFTDCKAETIADQILNNLSRTEKGRNRR